MNAKAKRILRPGVGAARMVEDIIGCKWSLTVLALVAGGVSRPGAMQRRVAGLTAKVLNERLRKLLRFGIIERQVFAEVPPRVEYRLTAFGRKFDGVLREIAALDGQAASGVEKAGPAPDR
jgi:DNA-binding HxlR family transcriptional regulator